MARSQDPLASSGEHALLCTQMRILKFLFTTLFFFGVIGVGGFLVIREGLLYRGVSSLERSLQELRSAAGSGVYDNECQNRGGGDNTSEFDEVVSYQLRFLSQREYVLEAVCYQFSLNPIVISRGVLPEFISKSVGNSGFLWSRTAVSSVELAVFGDLEKQIQKYVKFDTSFLVRKKSLVVAHNNIATQGSPVPGSRGPVTSCQGYGYQCCEQLSQIGIGNQIKGTTGCSETCFSTCASRPHILFFNSNPFFDIKTRILTLDTTQAVEFTYVADSDGSEELTGIFDFGDGQQTRIIGRQGHASHTYSCPQGRCKYTAKIRLTDKWGVESTDTPINQIIIQFVN